MGMPRTRPTLTRRTLTRPTRWDVLLPAGLALLAVVEMVALRPSGWGYGVALEVAACTLLVWRRPHTLPAATGAGMVLLVMPWVGPQLDEPSVPIMIWAVAVFALGRWPRDLRGTVGVVLVLLAILADYVLVDLRHHNLSDVMFVLALIVPPYVLGRITRRLADQKLLLEEREELVKREAVRAERDRIARELHDVIAHSVSAMVVQTAAAQDLVRSDPERTAAVLADVAETGRLALVETGRLLHVIRDEDDELGLQPGPGLADLPELVAGFRASGLQVDLDLELDAGSTPVLPAGVDVSAYRVVQEALTNALRYTGDGTATLRVARSSSALSILVTNPAGGPGPSGSGLGLLGMAERVAVLGGRLTHGLTGDGRYELAATVPVP
jgi:signal transduction histidine kinase